MPTSHETGDPTCKLPDACTNKRGGTNRSDSFNARLEELVHISLRRVTRTHMVVRRRDVPDSDSGGIQDVHNLGRTRTPSSLSNFNAARVCSQRRAMHRVSSWCARTSEASLSRTSLSRGGLTRTTTLIASACSQSRTTSGAAISWRRVTPHHAHTRASEEGQRTTTHGARPWLRRSNNSACKCERKEGQPGALPGHGVRRENDETTVPTADKTQWFETRTGTGHTGSTARPTARQSTLHA